jgi:hypothetical protein
LAFSFLHKCPHQYFPWGWSRCLIHVCFKAWYVQIPKLYMVFIIYISMVCLLYRLWEGHSYVQCVWSIFKLTWWDTS